MKTILVIIKKELKRFFTDKRMLVGLVLPGVLIFLIYSLMGDFVSDMATGGTDFDVVVINEQEELAGIHVVEGWNINVYVDEQESAINRLKDNDVDLVIVYDEDFYDKMITYDYSSGLKAPDVEIYYNSTDTSSAMLYQYYQSVYMSIEGSLTNKFDLNGLNNKYDVASEEDFTMQMMTMLMPFLFVTFLFSGCMSVCSESIAGEKERGTIATLLVTPVKRSQLVIGKVISLGIVALFSAIVSFVGLMASIPKLLGTEFSLSFEMYGLGTFVLIFIVILSTVLIFTVILMMVSTFAKSVKEASSYAIPVMLVVMVCGIGNFASTGAATNSVLYLIPIYNSIQCITGVLSLNVNLLNLGIAVISNLIYFGVGIFILTKMFNSEKIMFQK